MNENKCICDAGKPWLCEIHGCPKCLASKDTPCRCKTTAEGVREESFAEWLYELDEQEIVAARDDIVKAYKQACQDTNEQIDISHVNRVEVIDHTKTFEEGGGRAYTFWQDGVQVELHLQDDGRTMKIFIEKHD